MNGGQPPALHCPGCRRPIDPDADRCPHCGADVRVIVIVETDAAEGGASPRRRHRWLLIPAALAAWFLVWSIATRLPGGSGSFPGLSRPSPSTSPGVSLADLGGYSALRSRDRWVCSLNGYYAFGRGGLYYPPNHPSLPVVQDEEPAACFRSAAAAELAGFTLAPAPGGSVVAGGLYFRPAVLTNACEQASRSLGFAVPCPTRLPDPGFRKAMPQCEVEGSAPCTRGEFFLLEYTGFPFPPGFWRSAAGEPRLAIMAFADLRPAGNRFPCSGGFGALDTDVDLFTPFDESPRSVTLFACGHVHAVWHEDGVTYSVSFDGDGPKVREALLALVSYVRLHEPR